MEKTTFPTKSELILFYATPSVSWYKVPKVWEKKIQNIRCIAIYRQLYPLKNESQYGIDGFEGLFPICGY